MRYITIGLGLLLAFLGSTSHADVDQQFQMLQAKPDILYAFLKAMPKGGELHYHFDGAVDIEPMLHTAADSKVCIDPTSLASEHCQASNALAFKAVLRNPAMISKIVHAWSMQDFVAHQESGHDHFFSVFPKVSAVYADDSLKGRLLADILQKAADQHELYMEIIAFGLAEGDDYANLIDQEHDFSKKMAILLANPAFQRSIAQIVNQSKTFLPTAHSALHCDTQHHPACDIQVNFQYYIRRVKSIDSVFAQALAGFVAANQASNIVGINLVDIEDNAVAQRDYTQQMQIFDFFHHQYPKVHIALHAGELYPKTVVNHLVASPIRDAILLGHAERIGHGLDILDEPNPKELAQTMANQSIAVEINLSSNHLVFGVQGKRHPLGFYLTHHVPVVLSTDDEGILRTALTNEYLTAVREHGIHYTTLKRMNRNTLTYGFIAGNSIWADPENAKLVPQCRVLTSTTCRKFITHNPKAQLQWHLEQKLLTFEQQWLGG